MWLLGVIHESGTAWEEKHGPGTDENSANIKDVIQSDEVSVILGGIHMSNINRGIYEYVSQVQEQPVKWLWYPYIPCGKLTLLQGDPGEGKSTFMLNIVARLTRGLDMPDGYKIDAPCTVVYQCAEDGMADTTKPRLLAAGADCDRVAYIIDDTGELTLDDTRIEDTIRETGARLLILDPLQSFLVQDGDMHSAGRMRMVLGKLAGIAAKNNCAVVLIGHMNKAAGGKNLYRGLGSIDIAAIARSVLMIARDESCPEIRYMFPVKSSLAPEGDAISFSFSREHGFRFIGPCSYSEPEPQGSFSEVESKKDMACKLVSQLLLRGDLPSSDIIEELLRRGMSKRTIYTAKKELCITSYKQQDVWYWHLPEDVAALFDREWKKMK